MNFDKLFLTVLNMSLTAGFVIAAIIVARLFLKKTPKIISYTLWIAAGFRLIFPFSIESVISLIPFKPQPIPQDIVKQTVPRIDSGITVIDNAVSSILPSPAPIITPQDVVTTAESVNPLQIFITVGAIIWLIGIAAMLIYSVVSLVILNRKLKDATLTEDNIYEAANIKTPFVLGIFKPKIYIPANLTGGEKNYIILHERTHIKRRDNIIKFFAYFVLSLHWFNPLVWIAFILMGSDMEMSCDEKVLRQLGGETKKAYSMSLLSLATERRIINGSPLAFGEGDTKKRIKNVLNFKKHSKIIVTIAVIVVAVLTVGFTVNRVSSNSKNDNFMKNEFEIDSCKINVELPKNFKLWDPGALESSYSYLVDTFIHSSDLFSGDASSLRIIKDGEIVGTVAVMSVDVTDEMFETYKANPENSHRAIYYPLPMGSMSFWGTDYKVVYESENQREGSATNLVYYRYDYLKTMNITDLWHFGNPFDDEFTHENYYNKGIMGYNLDLNKIVVIELYYDSVTDEELTRIAGSLRITGTAGEEKTIIGSDTQNGVTVSIESIYGTNDNVFVKLKVETEEAIFIDDNQYAYVFGNYFIDFNSNPDDLVKSIINGESGYMEVDTELSTEHIRYFDMRLSARHDADVEFSLGDGKERDLVISDLNYYNRGYENTHFETTTAIEGEWRLKFSYDADDTNMTPGDILIDHLMPINIENNNLIRATGVGGIEGYVYNQDLQGEQPKNPEEAVEYMKRLEELNEQGIFSRFIPLYAEDGITVIGEFEISIDLTNNISLTRNESDLRQPPPFEFPGDNGMYLVQIDETVKYELSSIIAINLDNNTFLIDCNMYQGFNSVTGSFRELGEISDTPSPFTLVTTDEDGYYIFREHGLDRLGTLINGSIVKSITKEEYLEIAKAHRTWESRSNDVSEPPPPDDKPAVVAGVRYENMDYGFSINLPADWENYTVEISEWRGQYYNDDGLNGELASGPAITIIHPSSTEEKIGMFIPIWVFTYKQWEATELSLNQVVGALQIFSVSGMPPISFARNDNYVFAFTPRYYNWDFYDIIDEMIKNGAVQMIP